MRAPDGLSAEEMKQSLERIPSTLGSLRSPMGEPGRSESVAGMDMLNDMFQRQARRLESQLYQRAQDQRTLEQAQKQATLAMAQVRQLEQHYVEQAARIRQGAKSLQLLQAQIRDMASEHERVLSTCEALAGDVEQMRALLEAESPASLQSLQLRDRDHCSSVVSLRSKAAELEATRAEAERSAQLLIGATPPTTVAMLDANPLHDLSVAADYARKKRPAEAPASPH